MKYFHTPEDFYPPLIAALAILVARLAWTSGSMLLAGSALAVAVVALAAVVDRWLDLRR